jgi:hypothetical protein
MTQSTYAGWFAWTKHDELHGDSLTDYPTVWFAEEFLHRPRARIWEVTTTDDLMPYKVRHIETGRVWILTGRHDLEKNMYEARWPD